MASSNSKKNNKKKNINKKVTNAKKNSTKKNANVIKNTSNNKKNNSKKSNVKNNIKSNTTKVDTKNKINVKNNTKKVDTKNNPKNKINVKNNTKKVDTKTNLQPIKKKVDNNKKVQSTKIQNKNIEKTIAKKDIKPDINKYVNVLFKEKQEKKKSRILKLIFSIIIISIIGISIYIILTNKDNIFDKILDNKYVKVMTEKPKKEIKKTSKKEVKKIPIINTDKIAILTFHRITTEETKKQYFSNNEWVQSVDMFEQQMKYLSENGYKTLNLDEFNCWYDGECKFDKKTVVLTFDDGDLSFYYLVAPILKKYNFKATMFIVGSRTEDKEQTEFSDKKRLFITKETMENSRKKYPNIYYESHSYDFHEEDHKRKVYGMTRVELQEDFDSNKQFNFKYIAYPYGNYDEALLEKTEDNGYIMGFTFRNYDYATRDSKRFEIPRFKINGESNIDTIKEILDY